MKTRFTEKTVFNVNSNNLGRSYCEIKNNDLQTLKYLKIFFYDLHFILYSILHLFVLEWDLSTIHKYFQSFNEKIKHNSI